MSERLWRDGATEQELEQVRSIDVQIEALAWKRSELTRKRYLITNRACQRARYANQKIGVASRADSDNISLTEAGDRS
jgi:hypothetical protein